MQFKIFRNKNLIQGISNIAFGSINNKRAIEFLKSIGYPKIGSKNLIWAKQTFSSNVHICKVRDSGKIIKNVDGLISNIPDQILAIITADCVPILLFDPGRTFASKSSRKKQVVGALHGGRECLTKGIIKEAIRKMKVNFNSDPKDFLVGIGPHIRKCHYWLKEGAYQNLKNTSFKKYFIKKENKIYFDLTKIVFDQLQKEGVLRKNIKDCRICTFCNYKNYFSARKDEELPGIYPEKDSRFASFIGLL